MKKITLFFALLLSLQLAQAQCPYQETFEGFPTQGLTTFVSNGVTFDITTLQVPTVSTGTCFFGLATTSSIDVGWNSVTDSYINDRKLIENIGSRYATNTPGASVKISSATPFSLRRFFVFVSKGDYSVKGTSGTISIVGKNGSTTVFNVSVTSSSWNSVLFGTPQNGYNTIDLATFGGQDNSFNTITEFTVTTSANSNMEYLAIDDLQFGPANPTAPTVASIAASNIGTSSATLNGTVNANGLTTTSQGFQYSLSPTLASGVTTVAATPTTASGSSVTNVSANLSALSPNTTYYYRTIATNCHGNKYSSISSFATTSVASTNADLSALTISSGTLAPSFAATTTAYSASVTNATSSITVTPTKADANATIQVQVNSGGYATVTSGSASSALSLNVGTNTIDVKVTAQNGTTIKTYTITVTRAAAIAAITPPGNALNFDGTNDFVQTTAFGSESSGYFTFEAWLRPNHATNTLTFISTREPAEYTFDAKLDGGNKILVTYGNGGGGFLGTPRINVLTFNYNYTVGKWMHVAIVFDGVRCYLYVNGVLIGAPFTNFIPTPFLTQSVIKIGSVLGSQYFNGSIDEVRIWGIDRTATDIQSNFKDTVARNSTDLLAYYRFDEGTAGATNTGLTTLPNLVGSGLTGTLNNFALTGSSSNYVESYAMAIPTATAATSITSTGFTANWTAPVRGIVDNGYRLEVSTDTTFATGAIAGSPFTISSGTNRAITGLTAGTKYFYRVVADKTSVTGQGGYSSTITTTTTPIVTLTPPGNALSFDGTNDYVQTTALGSFISGNCTLEAWVLPKHATNTICFLSTREPQEYTFDAKLDGGNKILVDFGNGVNSWGSGLLSFDYAYTINKWMHIAIVVNGTNCSLYVNGTLIATKNIGFNPVLFNTTSYLKIGAVQGVQYFNGNIDEVRIWSSSRTAIDIQNNFKDTVARNSSGLFAYYRFDEGTAGTTNTGITSLPNLASSSLTGTLTNFALTGTSSNWVESYAMAIPTATAATSITSTGFTANWTAPTRGTVDNGYRLEVSTDTTFATGAIAGSPFTISSGTSRAITGLTAGTKYFYRVVADKTSVTGQGGYSATIVANTVMPLVPPGNALSFDGTNDYVQTTALGSVLSSNFTLEAWILPKHATNTICFLSTREPQEYTFDAKLDGGNKILVDLGNGANSWGSGLLSFDYIYSINKWMHIAIAVSGTNCSLYVNGALVATKNIGFNPVLFNTTSYLKIGAVQGVQYFNGNIDEVRIWNTSRTATDIQNNFKDTIARNSAGLLAYYRFDEGTAGSTNTGLTILPNVVGSSLTGTLTNVALTGSSSNYVESYAMAIPTATAATSITGTGFTANWTAPLRGIVDNGYRLGVSTSADFSTQISGSPFTITSGLSSAVTGLTPGATYYYVLVADKTSVTGQGGLSNTITVVTGTLPLKLVSFTAIKKDNNSVLNWVTDNEVNTHYTNIEFSTNGGDWEVIGKVNNNNTAGKNDYQFTHPITANYQLLAALYYRLKQVDLDGKYSYSEVRLVKQSSNQTAGILVYPNPVKNGRLNIDLGENITKPENYTITTVAGKTVQQGSIAYRQQVINVGNLSQGTYLLKVGNRKTLLIVCE